MGIPLRRVMVKFRDGSTLLTIPNDLPLHECIVLACKKAAQTAWDVTAAREMTR